jgi:hypothetical protein
LTVVIIAEKLAGKIYINSRLGGLIYLYITIKNDEADENDREKILANIIELLKDYEKFEEIYLTSCLEILCNSEVISRYIWS